MPRLPRPLPRIGDRYLDTARFHTLTEFNPLSGCQEWQGPINNAGYGMMGYRDLGGQGRMMTAHRAAWMIHHNTTIPQGQQVQHRCHNRRCCTPQHLKLGDHQTKMKDMMVDQRHGFQIRPGHECQGDRLNWHLHYDASRQYSREDIQFARSHTVAEIAERFGVTHHRAERLRSLMRNGYSWLPYDRAGTRLRPGRKPRGLDNPGQDPV